jgi:transposase
MSRVTRAASHLTVAELDARIKQTREWWRIRRWLVIRHALVHPKPAQEIALEVGLAKQTVHNLLSAYNREGPSVLETPGKGQRQRAYLSLAQEREFLEAFTPAAGSGQVSTPGQIQQALEQRLGHPVAPSTVYRLLHRHQWRKVTPRPRHPEADGEAQQAFKKTSRSTSSNCLPSEIPRRGVRWSSWPKTKPGSDASLPPDDAGRPQACVRSSPDRSSRSGSICMQPSVPSWDE